MEDIYKNIDHITGSTQQKLIDGKHEAFHSKLLTQIMTVPGYEDIDIEHWLCQPDFECIKTTLSD
jgi:5'-3' exonuclease